MTKKWIDINYIDKALFPRSFQRTMAEDMKNEQCEKCWDIKDYKNHNAIVKTCLKCK